MSLHCRTRAKHCGPGVCACKCADCFNARHNMEVETFSEEDAWEAPTKVRVIRDAEAELPEAELPQVPAAHCSNSIYCDRTFCMCACARCYQAKQKEGDLLSQEVKPGPKQGRVEIFDADLANEVFVCCACEEADGRGIVLGGSADKEGFLAFCPPCQDALLIALLHRKVLKITGRAGADALSVTDKLPGKPKEPEKKETSNAA